MDMPNAPGEPLAAVELPNRDFGALLAWLLLALPKLNCAGACDGVALLPPKENDGALAAFVLVADEPNNPPDAVFC